MLTGKLLKEGEYYWYRWRKKHERDPECPYFVGVAQKMKGNRRWYIIELETQRFLSLRQVQPVRHILKPPIVVN